MNLIRILRTPCSRAIALRLSPRTWVAIGWLIGPVSRLEHYCVDTRPFPGGGKGRTRDIRLWRIAIGFIRRTT